MVKRVPRVTGIEKALLAALAAWGLFPLVLLLVHAGQAHARFTGADGLIGADGVLGADQLQYLAWARDAGAHGLASDLFSLAPSGHVYLEPIFTIVGGLHRIGLSLAARLPAVQAGRDRRPAAGRRRVGAADVRRPTRRPGGRRRPVAVLVHPAGRPVQLDAAGRRVVPLLAVPARRRVARRRQAVGLRAERVRAWRSCRWRCWPSSGPLASDRGRRPVASWPRWPALVACVATSLAGHHVDRDLRRPVRARPRAHTGSRSESPPSAPLLPLGYYALLSSTDPAWKLASHYEVIPRLPALVLLAGLGPLALIAALGVRRPRGDVIEQHPAAVDRGLPDRLLRQRLLRPPCPAGPQLPAGGAGRPRRTAAARAAAGGHARHRSAHRPRAGLRRAQDRQHGPQREARAVLPPRSRRPRAELGGRPRARAAACSPPPRSRSPSRRRPGARCGSATATGAGTTSVAPARPMRCSAAGWRRPAPVRS